jgi:hypothetical protein
MFSKMSFLTLLKSELDETFTRCSCTHTASTLLAEISGNDPVLSYRFSKNLWGFQLKSIYLRSETLLFKNNVIFGISVKNCIERYMTCRHLSLKNGRFYEELRFNHYHGILELEF